MHLNDVTRQLLYVEKQQKRKYSNWDNAISPLSHTDGQDPIYSLSRSVLKKIKKAVTL